MVRFNLLDGILDFVDFLKRLILRFFVTLGYFQTFIFKDVVEFTVETNLVSVVLEVFRDEIVSTLLLYESLKVFRLVVKFD